MRTSPSFIGTIVAGNNTFQQNVIIDSGCTGEAVVSDRWVQQHKLEIRPSVVKDARMADGSSSLDILGELTLNIKVCGNNHTINALVSRGGDDFLLGTPGAENIQLCVDFKS